MKYTPKLKIPYPEDPDLISNYLPMFNDAMDIINTHTHEDEIKRLRAMYDRCVALHQQLDLLAVKKFPGMETMKVTQTKDQGFRFPAKRRFNPSKTAVSVVSENRCFIYYNPKTSYWVIVQVEPSTSEKESGVLIPEGEFQIVVYSTDPVTTHTPPSILPDSDVDDTPTTARASAKKKSKKKEDEDKADKADVPDKNFLKDPVWVLGDSLTVGSKNYIESAYKKAGKTVKVTAQNSITAADGVKMLDQASPNAKTWVIALGTNPMDTGAFKSACQKILDKAGNKTVYWINVVNFDNPENANDANDVLKKLVRDNDNMRLVNYAAEAKGKRHFFNSDGVHMSAAGYEWRAKFYGPRNPNG